MKRTLIPSLMFLIISMVADARPIDQGELPVADKTWRDAETEKITKKLLKKRGRKAQVIIIADEDKPETVPGQIGASVLAADALASALRKAGAEIIDRELPKSLKTELLSLEQSGKSSGVSYEMADAVFKTEVTNIKLQKSHTAGGLRRRDDSKEWVYTPPSCFIMATAEVSVLKYSLSPMKLLEQKTFTEKESGNHEGVKSCRDADISSVASAAVTDTFINRAGLLTAMLGTEGRILEERSKKKKHYFMTSLVHSESLSPNTKVDIFKLREVEVRATGEMRTEKVKLAEGKIVETTDEDYIWIEVKESRSNKTSEVLIGDIVVPRPMDCTKLFNKAHPKCLKNLGL